jgi:uncharacterized protein YidB (DUF937 family)
MANLGKVALAMLGILAYQNRDKIGEMLRVNDLSVEHLGTAQRQGWPYERGASLAIPAQLKQLIAERGSQKARQGRRTTGRNKEYKPADCELRYRSPPVQN